MKPQRIEPRRAVICKNTWAGYIESPCRVVGETATRWQVEVDEPTLLPSRTLQPGQRALVSKNAIRFVPPNNQGNRRA